MVMGAREDHFRKILGQYPTGVVVVTARSKEGEVYGMTLGSFGSMSMDPPIVGFMPRVESESWAQIRECGEKVCINILANSQENVCRAVATRRTQKFDGIPLKESRNGGVVIEGALAYIDCTVFDSREVGDHLIVLAKVDELDIVQPGDPLLFFRGGYGSFSAKSLAAGGEGLLHELATVDVARPELEFLASAFDTEVSTVHLVGDEFVVTTSSGLAKTRITPTRVGHRFPFAPPLGAVFAAWGDPALQERWMSEVSDPEQRRFLHDLMHAVRQRGFNVNLGHKVGEEIDLFVSDSSNSAAGPIIRLMREAASEFAPMNLTDSAKYEFRSATAPVFDVKGEIVFAVTIWGPAGTITGQELLRYTTALQSTVAKASEALVRSRLRV